MLIRYTLWGHTRTGRKEAIATASGEAGYLTLADMKANLARDLAHSRNQAAQRNKRASRKTGAPLAQSAPVFVHYSITWHYVRETVSR